MSSYFLLFSWVDLLVINLTYVSIAKYSKSRYTIAKIDMKSYKDQRGTNVAEIGCRHTQ